MAQKRKSTGKRLRFQVFERDGFTCQYCGRKTPEVILHVDHIYPVSKGGTNDVENLITSCVDCNLGKSTTELGKAPKRVSVNSDDLQERYDQLKAFYDLQKKVEIVKNDMLLDIHDYWTVLWDGYALSEKGLASIKMFLRKFSSDEIKEAMDIARTRITNPDNAFKYMCGILHTKARER